MSLSQSCIFLAGLLGVGMQKYSESQTLSTDPNIRMTQLAQVTENILTNKM